MKKFRFRIKYQTYWGCITEDIMSFQADTLWEAIQEAKDKFNEDWYNILDIYEE